MAEYQITYWRKIPTMVTAREGRQHVVKLELAPRFLVAVDEAAMRLGMTGSDSYMEQWHKPAWQSREGTPEEAAKAIVDELEAEFTPAVIRAILDEYGPGRAPAVEAMVGPEHRLIRWLEEGRLVVGDGAMGTMLQASGLTDGGAPELWNVTQPAKIRAIYEGYAEAGSNIITTNTFGGTSARLKLHHLQDRVVELNRAGALLAREVADLHGALVAGDIGPSGELIEPVGPLSMVEAQAIFAEQVRGLVEGGVDFFLIETMSHLNEVEAAVLAIREIAPQLPIAVTLSFDTNYHTMMGVSPRQAVETLASWGVSIAGANCGNGPAEIEVIMTQMAQSRPAGIYLMAQSNAGLPKYDAGEIRYDGTPAIMADLAVRLRSLGVNVIGACCGSTPAHIAAMAAALDAVKDEPVRSAPAAEGAAIESAESRAQRAASRRAERHSRNPQA
jgi:5-methyltetrahydrofolate--homocysteine methyltransferase